jgi:hydroxymethylpyrimidine pyrophosphatase-like HAD family hydrolase
MNTKGQSAPRLIATDLDGTLAHSGGYVSARNRAALALAHAAGIEVVVATGRRHSFALQIVRELNLPPQHALISSNGTVIRTIGSDLLHRSHMPLETARWLIIHAAEFRSTLVLTFDTVGPTGHDTRGALVCESLDDLNATVGRWMTSNRDFILQVSPIEDGLNTAKPIQMMLCGTIARMQAAEALLAAHPCIAAVGAPELPGTEVSLHRTAYPERDLTILDILPAGSSKASALTHLANLRGISMSEVLAIGDNWNDLSMLEAAGHAVLMANAPPELLALARERNWTIAPAHDDDGFAIAIEEALAVGVRP